MYRIINSTDGKYKGTLLNEKEIYQGSVVSLVEFNFRIDSIKEVGDTIILINPNYIIYCVKE